MTQTSTGLTFQRVIELLGVVLTLAITAASERLPRWFLLVPAAYLLFIIAVWVGPALWSKVSGQVSARRRLQQLHARWPAFQVKVGLLREFFDEPHPRSVLTLLRRMQHPTNEPERRAIEGFQRQLNRPTANLVVDAMKPPKSLHEGKRVVRDFEALLVVLIYSGVEEYVRKSVPEKAWEETREDFLKNLDQLRRGYREFATEANGALGEAMFGKEI